MAWYKMFQKNMIKSLFFVTEGNIINFDYDHTITYQFQC